MVMPKVSQNPISKDTERKIFEALIRTFTKITDTEILKSFIDDLLTPTEKVMIAKRLMVAILLQRGHAPGAICSILKMSKTTVNDIRKDLQKHGQGYKAVFRKFFVESGVGKFIGSVENWLDSLSLPVKGSKSDMRRWKKSLN